ncbi:MAG: hypothetical protein FWG29_01070 [Treponema sp.]|nr:hypothetical protein [Treponema sp.]
MNESGILTGTALTVNANAGIILEGNNLINGTASLNNTTGLPLAGDISFNNTISTGTLQLTAANNTANGNIGVTNKNPLTTGVIIAGSVGSRGNVDITNENTIIVNGNITADEVTLITDNDSGDLINNITISDDISGIVSKLTIISGDLYGAYDYCGTVTISNPITLTDGAAEIEISAGVITGSGNLSAAGGVSFLLDEFNTYTGSISDSFSIGPRHRADLIYYTTLPSLLGTHLPADAVQVSSSAYSGDFNFTDFTNVYLVNVSDSNVGRTVTVNASGIIEFYDSYTYNPVTPSPNPHLNLTGNGGIRTYHPDTITPGTTVININTPFTTNTPLDATQPLTISAGHLSISANGIILGGNVNGAPASVHNLLLDTTRAAGYAINVVGNIGNVNPLGNIEVRSINPSNTTTPTISWGVYFGGTITARSYKQTGTGGTGGNGSTYINGTQSYNPVSGNAFEFEGYDLTVISTMGTTGTPIGPILINNANVVQFDDEIWAGSFTQSAANITTGATSFDSTQTYSGNFTFTGRVLNVNNSLNTGGDITITNSGTFTKGVSTTQHIVATGVFLQNGAGENTIGANITASAITFSNLVELSANAVFATTGNGNIVLSGNSTGTVATADTSGADRNLTLTAAGTGTITLGSPSAPSTGNTVDLGTGTLTVTASTVTTAAAVPLNIGTGITTATNLTINNGTSFDPKEVLTVWGDTTNNGTINAATPSSGNDSIFFNGDYNGSSGTIVDTGNSNRIVFNGEIAAVGTFNNTTDTLVLKGQYTPSGTDQEFSHNTSTPLYIVRIENRNSTSTGINTVRLESDVVQTDNGTGGELYFDMTPNTSAGPKLYTTANYTWRMGTGTPPTTPSPPAPFGYGFVNYKGEVVFDPGSELHTQDFLAPQTGSPSPYTYTFNGPASIWAAGNVDIRDDNPGNVFITTAPDELNIFTLVMNGGGSVQSLHCEQIGSTSHAAIGSLRLTGSAQVRIINSIEIQGDVLIEPGTTLFAGYPGNSITIHVTGYHNPAAKIDRGANWFQTLPVVVDPGPPEEVVLGIGPSGTFVPYNSTVEFGSKTSTIPPSWDGRTFRISGNTTWYNLFCYEPKADLLFSNYGVTDLHEHTIHNRFEVEPRRANGDLYGSAGDITNMIKISRLTFTQLTPVTNNVIGIYGPPTIPNNDFWYFRLGPGAELFFNFVFLNYSYSQRRIPLPYGDPAQFLVIATPYYNRDPDNSNLYDPRVPGGNLITAGEYSYYNVNWFVANNFFYSFTEDSTGNGKIDRIRAQAAFELMDGSDTSPETGYEAFQYFKVIVDGYEIDTSRGYNNTGYDRVPGATDCIYIYVKEKPSSDGGETPTWRIERNQSLMDATTKSIFIGEPAHGDHQTSDTVPPRINYAFALPGHTEQFFQLSELVNNGDITSSINSGTLTPLGRGEFLVDISAYDLNQLVTGNESFDLDNVRDRAGFIRDRRSEPGVLYAYQYPSPKYPKDWDYSDYIEVRGWYDQVNMGNSVSFMPITNDPGDLPPIREWYYDAANPNNSSYPSYSSSFVGPDPKLGNRMFGKTNGLTAAAADYGKGRHRVTDMLISIPPNNLGDTAQHDYFFIWPLWAKYASEGSNLDDLLGNTLHPGYGYMGHDGSNIIDSSIIWDFTGKRFLERDDIVMQSRISDGFSAAVSPVTIFYNTGPSDYYRATTVHGSVGLWHPYQGLLTPPLSKSYIEFFNMVPYTFPNKNSPSPDDVGNNLFNHSFDKSYFPGNATVEFYYHLDVSDENLLAARLDVPPGTDPSTLKGQPWYRWVRPFTFGIHDITRQRGGVTILNNVINSNNRERVYVDYKPESSGRVTIQVFTLDGNLVKILKRGSETADGKYHRVSWDGTNEGGRPVARGMYFIRVVAPGIDEIRKVMVVK